MAPVTHAVEDPLTLGIFPRNKATDTTTMYTPLANYLTERLGRQVLLVTSKDFDAFWKAVTEGRYDIVHYNQYHYTVSAKSYRVIGHNQEFGKNAVAGALFVRKDSGNQTRLTLTLERLLAREHFVHDGPEREDVRPRVRLVAFELLRRHVLERAENRAMRRQRRHSWHVRRLEVRLKADTTYVRAHGYVVSGFSRTSFR